MSSDSIRLFDTHAHLDFKKLAKDREGVLQRAREAGVARIVTIGASDGLDSNYRALEIARKYDHIRCTAGIHPHDAAMCDDEVFDTIADEFAELGEVVAIGETGLDYHYDNSPRQTQRAVFRRFLELAMEVDKPVVIHSREAEEDTIEIIREVGNRRGILHCFAGSRQFAEAGLELGFHISFSGIATFNSTEELRRIAAEVPEDRILVETDAPFLAPVPKRGRTNEPAYVRHTASAVAEARGQSLPEFAQQTFDNACRLYGWDA